MRFLALLSAGLLVGALAVACQDTPFPAQPTELPALPTAATVEAAAPTETSAALATVAVDPTDSPASEPSPTAEAPEVAASPTVTLPPPTATAEPVTTSEPAATDTAEPEPSPTPAPPQVETFAPGQQDSRTLASGESWPYLFQGTRFRPAILFVEPGRDLDSALASYVGDVSQQTTPDGATPVVAADNALAGRPEILVLSAESDGLYTFVVRAASGEGDYTAYLYDLTSPAAGMAVQQPDTVAAGETRTYTVTSNGPRPVIVAVDPSDQSDVALDIFDSAGALVATANYSGAGGVETAYVLPLGTVTYSVAVREAGGQPSAFDVAIITLE